DSESVQISNFVTNDELPTKAATAFATTCPDPDNFRIEVQDALPLPSVTAKLELLRGGAVQVGPLTHTLMPGAGNNFRSILLRLVSDTSDDAASGSGSAADPDNQTILAQLDDRVRLTYHAPPAGPDFEIVRTVGRPSSEDDNGANG